MNLMMNLNPQVKMNGFWIDAHGLNETDVVRSWIIEGKKSQDDEWKTVGASRSTFYIGGWINHYPHMSYPIDPNINDVDTFDLRPPFFLPFYMTFVNFIFGPGISLMLYSALIEKYHMVHHVQYSSLLLPTI